jgi:hypothetical protein
MSITLKKPYFVTEIGRATSSAGLVDNGVEHERGLVNSVTVIIGQGIPRRPHRS